MYVHKYYKIPTATIWSVLGTNMALVDRTLKAKHNWDRDSGIQHDIQQTELNIYIYIVNPMKSRTYKMSSTIKCDLDGFGSKPCSLGEHQHSW